MLGAPDCDHAFATRFVAYANPGQPRADRSLGPEAKPLAAPTVGAFPEATSLTDALGGDGRGGLPSVVRFDRLGAGPVEQRTLFAPPADADMTGVAAIPGSAVVFLGLCRPQCLRSGLPSGGGTTDLLRSDDGGVSWSKQAEAAGQWWLRGTIGGNALFVGYFGTTPRYMLLPEGRELVRPAGADANALPLGLDGLVAWPADGRAALLGEDGRTLATLPLASDRRLTVTAVAGNTPPAPYLFAVDVTFGQSEAPIYVNRYLLVAWRDANGAMTFSASNLYRLDGQELGNLGPVLDRARSAAATAAWRRPGACPGEGDSAGQGPAVLDFAAGTLSFLGEEVACAGGSASLVAIGAVDYRVNTPGECLNVREAPTTAAKSIQCLADGWCCAPGRRRSRQAVANGRRSLRPRGSTAGPRWSSCSSVASSRTSPGTIRVEEVSHHYGD